MIDQIQNIPSSTALLILKTWPSHHVGGEPNLLFMVLTQISVTIESIKKVTCVQNESFKIKTARVTYVFFESVTLNKYSKISVPTPTISVIPISAPFPHLAPTILTSPIPATAPTPLKY